MWSESIVLLLSCRYTSLSFRAVQSYTSPKRHPLHCHRPPPSRIAHHSASPLFAALLTKVLRWCYQSAFSELTRYSLHDCDVIAM